MIFSPNFGYVVVGRTGVAFFAIRQGQEFRAKYEFPTDVFLNLEILDKSRFVDGLTLFWREHPVVSKMNIVVLLIPEIVFEKTLGTVTAGEKIATINTFLKELPIASEKIGYFVENNGEGETIVAANKDLTMAISQSLEVVRAEILGIVAISESQAKAILKGERVNLTEKLKNNNWYLLDEAAKRRKMTNRLVRTFGGFAVGIILGVIVFGLARYSKQNAIRPSATNILEKPTVVNPGNNPEKTGTINKSDLKIKILNGANKPGAAAGAADFLRKLGYQKISTGNANVLSKDTLVIASVSAGVNVQKQLTLDLLANYPVATRAADYQMKEVWDGVDVFVIIGSLTK